MAGEEFLALFAFDVRVLGAGLQDRQHIAFHSPLIGSKLPGKLLIECRVGFRRVIRLGGEGESSAQRQCKCEGESFLHRVGSCQVRSDSNGSF